MGDSELVCDTLLHMTRNTVGDISAEDVTEMGDNSRNPWHERVGAVFSVNIQIQFKLERRINNMIFQSLLHSSRYNGR